MVGTSYRALEYDLKHSAISQQKTPNFATPDIQIHIFGCINDDLNIDGDQIRMTSLMLLMADNNIFSITRNFKCTLKRSTKRKIPSN